jgi:phosphatidylinositol glycan class O
MDKLQVLQKLAADEKKSARIFKALADPPTTSLQRLKVMSTAVCLFILSALQMLCQKKKSCYLLQTSMQYKMGVYSMLSVLTILAAKINAQALTTGGLPTFIDVGNSFGAPAIVEDNIMHQVLCTLHSTLVKLVAHAWIS